MENDTAQIESEIIGKWQWTETGGGFAGIKSNPSTVGYTMEIIFYKDKTYEIYKDNKLEKKGSFSIVRKKAVTGRDEYIIQYSNVMVGEIVRISGDKLSLAENVVDGLYKTYMRIK